MAQGNGTTEITPDLMAALQAMLNVPKTVRRGKLKKRAKPTEEETKARQAANDAECIKVFTAAGFTDIQPRVNVLTYDKWLATGRMVNKGEKSHQVGPFRLFHVSQTSVIASVQVSETTH